MSDLPTSVVLARKWRYAAPPWRLYEALVVERERWLEIWYDERTPEVTASEPAVRIVLAPWVHLSVNEVECLVAPDSASGSRLTVLVRGDHELSADERKAVKYRVGTLFGESLREWIDGW